MISLQVLLLATRPLHMSDGILHRKTHHSEAMKKGATNGQEKDTDLNTAFINKGVVLLSTMLFGQPLLSDENTHFPRRVVSDSSLLSLGDM